MGIISRVGYMVATAFGVFVGVYAGGIKDYQKFIQRTVYERRIEGDTRQYLIIETNGENFVMVRNDCDKLFKRLEDVYEEFSRETQNLKTTETQNLKEKLLSKD